jgi:hypothetical protein
LKLHRFGAGLRGTGAYSHPEHPEESLRGRTYAIPFATVWQAVAHLASGGLRGWTTVEADEDEGLLEAECPGLWGRNVDDAEVRVSLDKNGQTRVDMKSESRSNRRDLGRNARRIRRFFKALDREIGAGEGKILDPTVPLIRTGVLLLGLSVACGPADQPPTDDRADTPARPDTARNFQSRTYERHIVFLTFQEDSTLLASMSFSARTRADGVERGIRGWLARGETWDPFLSESWKGAPASAPWRLLPHGPVRLVVGLEDALETVIFQEGGRSLELDLGPLLVEWSGLRAQTFRVHEAALALADGSVEGHLLDMRRAWTTGGDAPGGWGILLSGDSLQVVFENLDPDSGADGGAFNVWGRVQFLDRQWQDVRFVWSDIRAYGPARRDVPTSWEIGSPEGELQGALSADALHLEAGEGDGPLLPVDGLFQVNGILSLEGADYPVRGLLRHIQR